MDLYESLMKKIEVDLQQLKRKMEDTVSQVGPLEETIEALNKDLQEIRERETEDVVSQVGPLEEKIEVFCQDLQQINIKVKDMVSQARLLEEQLSACTCILNQFLIPIPNPDIATDETMTMET